MVIFLLFFCGAKLMAASSRSTERFAYTVASLDDLEPTIAALLRAQIKDEPIRKIVIAPRQQRLVHELVHQISRTGKSE